MSKIVDKTGETIIAKNGLKMTIIVYRTVRDIDIQFEDGYVREHISYYNFLTGRIKHPDYKGRLKSRLGESNVANNGMNMTIIAYRGTADLDIQFEDGIIVRNKSYTSFKAGEIAHPKIHTQIHPDRYEGQVSVGHNGLKMSLVAYRRYNDVDLQFEDGVVVQHCNYRNFLDGRIAHPGINTRVIQKATKYVGKTIIATNGMRMTCIAYRSKYDVDLQFEDGVIVTGVSINTFMAGRIKHPINNRQSHLIETRIGETSINSQGLEMKIIAYRRATDVDIMFADQTTVCHKDYWAFKRGNIKYLPDSPCDNLVITALAYIHNQTGNFYCRCTKCGHKDIMTIPEMKSHICNI